MHQKKIHKLLLTERKQTLVKFKGHAFCSPVGSQVCFRWNSEQQCHLFPPKNGISILLYKGENGCWHSAKCSFLSSFLLWMPALRMRKSVWWAAVVWFSSCFFHGKCHTFGMRGGLSSSSAQLGTCEWCRARKQKCRCVVVLCSLWCFAAIPNHSLKSLPGRKPDVSASFFFFKCICK